MGDGPPVLLLHGGPGLSFTYLDALSDQLGGFRVASYQQRGLAPSSVEGPFSVSDHVADACAVMDELGWDRALVLGHSWGGHLALHLAVASPDRLLGALAVDTLGAVGDGGGAEFGAELMRRTPAEDQQRIRALNERVDGGKPVETDHLETLRLLWPAYFGRREDAPPMPPVALGVECSVETNESMTAFMPELESALGDIRVPVGFVTGERSPMPRTASTDAAARIPDAWTETVPGVGHFPWIERPGCMLAPLERLRAQAG